MPFLTLLLFVVPAVPALAQRGRDAHEPGSRQQANREPAARKDVEGGGGGVPVGGGRAASTRAAGKAEAQKTVNGKVEGAVVKAADRAKDGDHVPTENNASRSRDGQKGGDKGGSEGRAKESKGGSERAGRGGKDV
jgi:hypothetical protein